VVLNISIDTFLLSYLLIIPAAIRLRYKHPEVERPFRVPGGNGFFAFLGTLCFLWILLGSWVAVFPGTLEPLFGLDYVFHDEWGVSQGTFEALTLGTLAVLVVLALVGYWRGKRVRAISVAPDTAAMTSVPDGLPPAGH
jgi:amino acid transporter